MWSGPHMLIPVTQADRAPSYTLPSIYTLVQTLKLAFPLIIIDCRYEIVIQTGRASDIMFEVSTVGSGAQQGSIVHFIVISNS